MHTRSPPASAEGFYVMGAGRADMAVHCQETAGRLHAVTLANSRRNWTPLEFALQKQS